MPETEYSSSLAVDDHGRIHRKEVILAGVVDVQVRVQYEADVAHAHTMLGKLILDHVLVELQPAHAERLHDLVRAVASVDHNRISAAKDQKSQRQHTAGAPAVAAEDKEAQFEFDVAIVEDLDFQWHNSLPTFVFRCGP